MQRALFEVWPRLERTLAWLELGVFPTPIESFEPVARAVGESGELYVKRDDLSSPVYGGNKVRTLELLFAEAQRREATRIYATGAFGSNHATATVLHAPRVGLEPGVVLFAQPPSRAALENFRVSLARAADALVLPHWACLPYGMIRAPLAARRAGQRAFVMVPGGATPLGALGYVSAGLELAAQVRAVACPVPETVLVGVGSTCTSAGLLVGLTLAARLGLGFTRGAPALWSVRVSPWPVTARARIVRLAARTSALLAELVGEPALALGARELGARFRVDPAFLGAGYGLPTPEGARATELFASAGLPLDGTYSAKSAAAVLSALRRGARGPLLYWATKSSAPLPDVEPSALESAGALAARFLRRCDALREPSQ